MYLLTAILAIGLLIIVHEAGHYFVAKWCKMKVERFSIGFGPPILRWTRSGTQFQIAPIPFGGFVHINGMLVADEDDGDDPHSYRNRPAWQRFLTIFAGPATNYLFAIVLALLLYGVAGAPTGTVWYGVAKTEPGFDAHGKLEPGDRILEASWTSRYDIHTEGDGARVRALDGALPGISLEPTRVTVWRSGAEVTLEIVPLPEVGSEALGVALKKPDLAEAMHADRYRVESATGPAAGKLQPGDVLLRVERSFSGPFYAMRNRAPHHELAEITNHAVGAISLVVLRNGERVGPIELVPKLDDRPHKSTAGSGLQAAVRATFTRKRVGVLTESQPERVGLGVLGTLRAAVWYPIGQTQLIGDNLYKIITGKQEAQMDSVVGITRHIKRSAEEGWVSLLQMLMILNVSLGLFNLFPLPALDGGRLVFLIYEMATRKRTNPKLEATVHMVGILVLFVVVILVTYGDIVEAL